LKKINRKPPLPLPDNALPDLLIGRVGRPYGLKGWLKINSFTAPERQIIDYAPCFILRKGKPLLLSACKQHGNFLIGKIEGYDTPEDAKQLVNASIFISQQQLPALPQNEYYWKDLLQMDVFNLQKCYLGKIDSLFETGANDVVVILKDEKKILIPFVIDHFIQHIDLIKKTMVVDWQEDWL
jgi:16S rRNA processing protein RimM